MTMVSAPVHRLSVEDVYKMVEVGVLGENDRVELVEGVLVDMVPIGAEHDGATAWLIRHFARVDAEAWDVRIQSMLLVAGGYLLPDLALVDRLPRSELPTTAHLVVEIAQTSQARDRDKAPDYAAAAVPEYWVVDLPARTVLVHRRPLAGAYQELTTFADGASITPLLADAPVVDVSALLG
jgi:Uma2 family endonuclease